MSFPPSRARDCETCLPCPPSSLRAAAPGGRATARDPLASGNEHDPGERDPTFRLRAHEVDARRARDCETCLPCPTSSLRADAPGGRATARDPLASGNEHDPGERDPTFRLRAHEVDARRELQAGPVLRAPVD